MAVDILHLHTAFDRSDQALRTVRLMNEWGGRARHVIVSALPGALAAQQAIAPGITYEIAQNPPPLAGRPSVARYEAIARFMRGFDLVLTHDWGAIDGVMARRVFGKDTPPLVHHENGFDADEAGSLKIERSVYRRLALSAAHALAVPSETLQGIAIKAWKQPPARLHRIPNGIAAADFTDRPRADALPGFVRRPDEVVIGAVGPLDPVRDYPALVRAAGGLSGSFRLVIVGDGPERQRIEGAAMAMGIADRLVLPGFVADPAKYLGLFDMLAVSSVGEQFPVGVVQAMAAGLPVASLPVGDVSRMLSAANYPYVAQYRTEVKLRDAMQALMNDADARAAVGAANRARAVADHGEAAMIARYAALYTEAMGQPGVLG